MGNPLNDDLEERLRDAGIVKKDETFADWCREIEEEAGVIKASPDTDPRILGMAHKLELWARGGTR